MEPTLRAGQSVLVDAHAYRTARPSPGDVVVARHPEHAELWMIKRVQRLVDSRVFVIGDRSDSSTDSRDFGPIPSTYILGRVTSVLT